MVVMYSKQDQLERSLRELEALEEQLSKFVSACHDLVNVRKFLEVQVALLKQAITHLKDGMDQT